MLIGGYTSLINANESIIATPAVVTRVKDCVDNWGKAKQNGCGNFVQPQGNVLDRHSATASMDIFHSELLVFSQMPTW